MANRDNHYEAAFEAFLRDRRVLYVAVDEAKRCLLADGSLKSLDFIVSLPGGPNWLIDLKGLKGDLPVFVGFTTDAGLRYFADVEHNKTAVFPSGESWMTDKRSTSRGECTLTYQFLGPFAPAKERVLIAYCRLQAIPYTVGFHISFDSESPPAADEEILDDIFNFIAAYEEEL